MRQFLIPLLLTLSVGGVAWVLIVWLRSRPDADVDAGVGRMLMAHGAARCLEAVRLLRALAEGGSSPRIVGAWDRIELPLLQALPDCPPDSKVVLLNALDACAKACVHVETARRIMTMRNSLIA